MTLSATLCLLALAPPSGSPPVKVNFPMVAGGDVSQPSFASVPPDFRITRDGRQVVYPCDGRVDFVQELVYRSDEDTEGLFELFATRVGSVRARAVAPRR